MDLGHWICIERLRRERRGPGGGVATTAAAAAAARLGISPEQVV
jgi:hypothetical protein